MMHEDGTDTGKYFDFTCECEYEHVSYALDEKGTEEKSGEREEKRHRREPESKRPLMS